ncbi:DUF6356 family protein [Sphingomonas sp. A2-49]|uniref:DUF6356 family protein n=1 Tax=Sphingomonas sp. A2-49 TaxID=1391375 RepID=UPI0021CEB052|nr:DUF6356 family protein [Sphingomonas sp. A2-49]MCU6453819.1 DUF6356 family protein [Sphingomonas sp. A2-49]
MKPFTTHPASVGESYGQHFGVATRFGLRMIGGGVAAMLHGVFPFLFTTTGSRTIEALHAEIVAKRAHEAERRSVEFVI